MISKKFKRNEQYNIGAKYSYTNLQLVKKICSIFDNDLNNNKEDSSKLINFVEDRKGHDKKYSLDISKIKKEIKWIPNSNINRDLLKTIKWYLPK